MGFGWIKRLLVPTWVYRSGVSGVVDSLKWVDLFFLL